MCPLPLQNGITDPLHGPLAAVSTTACPCCQGNTSHRTCSRLGGISEPSSYYRFVHLFYTGHQMRLLAGSGGGRCAFGTAGIGSDCSCCSHPSSTQRVASQPWASMANDAWESLAFANLLCFAVLSWLWSPDWDLLPHFEHWLALLPVSSLEEPPWQVFITA